MSSFYRLDEARFIQLRTATSAANGLSLSVGPVPENKCWTILSGAMYPSADENTYYWFSIWDRGPAFPFPVTRPVQFQTGIAVAQYFPLLTEGTEIMMFQGEYIYAYRATAAAGSTITAYYRIIESDIPLHRYVEPQAPRKFRSGWFARTTPGGSGGGGGGEGAGGEPGGVLEGGGGIPVL